MEESEDSNAGYGQLIYLIKIKQTNKNYPVGEKQAGWLAGKAGLGWTRLDTDDINIRYEPTRNCKHKEILKGANDEGNEENSWGK